jgi:predicted nucleic acid-binding protein
VRVLVDSNIWSLALRRRPADLAPHEAGLVAEWEELVRAKRIAILGLVRHEVLAGVRDPAQFERLRYQLRAWPDEPVLDADYEEAARHANRLRTVGLASTTVDLMLCAVALRLDIPLFTMDFDFTRYIQHLPLRLHQVAAN